MAGTATEAGRRGDGLQRLHGLARDWIRRSSEEMENQPFCV